MHYHINNNKYIFLLLNDDASEVCYIYIHINIISGCSS